MDTAILIWPFLTSTSQLHSTIGSSRQTKHLFHTHGTKNLVTILLHSYLICYPESIYSNAVDNAHGSHAQSTSSKAHDYSFRFVILGKLHQNTIIAP